MDQKLRLLLRDLVFLSDRVNLCDHIALLNLIAHFDVELFDLSAYLRAHVDQIPGINLSRSRHRASDTALLKPCGKGLRRLFLLKKFAV